MLQVIALLKAAHGQRGQPLGQSQGGQAGAVVEGIDVDLRDGVWHVDMLQADAVGKQVLVDLRDSIWKLHRHQGGAVLKDGGVHLLDGVRDGDMGQAGVLKGRRAQPPDGGGDGDVRQAGRALKATGPDLVDLLTIDFGRDSICPLAACGIGLQRIGIVVLGFILHQSRAKRTPSWVK